MPKRKLEVIETISPKKKMGKKSSINGLEAVKSPKNRRKPLVGIPPNSVTAKKLLKLKRNVEEKSGAKPKKKISNDIPFENTASAKKSKARSILLLPSPTKKTKKNKKLVEAPVTGKKSKNIEAPKLQKALGKKTSKKAEETLPESEDSEVQEIQKVLKIKSSLIGKAIEGTIKFTNENPKVKNELFNKESFPLFLHINAIKVPQMKYTKILRIPLENSMLTPDSEVCLIVPDVKGIKNKEHEKHLEHYEEILRKKGVTGIKKIMTFHEFRTEYEVFEMRSRLVELYDVFLVDGRISGKVVNKCGKIFYKKRKVPTAIKLQVTKLKEHIDNTLKKTQMHLHGNGDSFTVQFGNNCMSKRELIENVWSILKGLKKDFPGGLQNIRSINVKAPRALAIPLYLNIKNRNDVPTPIVEVTVPKGVETVQGELSTREDTEVMVEPSGRVTIVKKTK